MSHSFTINETKKIAKNSKLYSYPIKAIEVDLNRNVVDLYLSSDQNIWGTLIDNQKLEKMLYSQIYLMGLEGSKRPEVLFFHKWEKG